MRLIFDRPSQKYFTHDLAIDVLPWSGRLNVRWWYEANVCRPGLRERAVLDQETTKSNRFWREVIQLFHFNWPYAPELLYQFNESSKLYSFTGTYENHIRDIRMWNMNPAFFSSFPATYDDIITPSERSPLYVQPSPLTQFRALAFAHADDGNQSISQVSGAAPSHRQRPPMISYEL